MSQLLDVRKMPGSTAHPHFNGETLSVALKKAGIGYLHISALGGLRRPRVDSPNGGWRNRSFQGYADYMQTEEFEAGLQTAIALARSKARRVDVRRGSAVALPSLADRRCACGSRHLGRAHHEYDAPPTAYAASIRLRPRDAHHLPARSRRFRR